MSNDEIVRSYRESKKKRSQISILAELNGTDPDTIKDILKEHGELGKPGPKPSEKRINEPVAEAKEPVAEVVEDRTVVTEELRQAVGYGLEYIDWKISEKEKELAALQETIDELKDKKLKILDSVEGYKGGDINGKRTDSRNTEKENTVC